MELSTATPVEIDTELARLTGELASAEALRQRSIETMHSMAGDKKVRRGRSQYWQMDDAEAEQVVRDWLASGEYFAPKATWTSGQGEHTIQRFEDALNKIDAIKAEMQPLDDEYERRPWNRFFLCTANNGHIHSSTHCHTLHVTSQLAWNPELSGTTEAEGVAKLGPILCTVCFPSAPVEWTRDPKDVKAAKDAETHCTNKTPAWAADGRGRRAYRRYANCDACGATGISVSDLGNLRKHKRPAK